MSIVTFGSVTWDVAAVRQPTCQNPARHLLGSGYAQGLGGKGANQAAAAARLGAELTLLRADRPRPIRPKREIRVRRIRP